MDLDTIYILICIALPVVAAIVTYFLCGRNLDKALDAYHKLEDVLKDKEDMIKGIIGFFDPEEPYAVTSPEEKEIIQQHPYSYKIEPNELKLIMDTCKDDEERSNVVFQIEMYEKDMIVDYNIITTGAEWRVYYGTPTRIDTGKKLGLTQKSIAELCDMFKGNDFLITYTILEHERNMEYTYDITIGERTIHVMGGEYSIQ